MVIKKLLIIQGKTEKEKGKDKAKSDAKNKNKDRVPKALKAGQSGGKKKVYFNFKIEMVKN